MGGEDEKKKEEKESEKDRGEGERGRRGEVFFPESLGVKIKI